MSLSSTMSQILETSENSYFRWKKKDHKILVSLIETYFNIDELEEWLEKDEIKKFELIKNISFEELNDKLNQNNSTIDLLSVTKELTSLKESLLRALRSVLRNLDLEPSLNFQNQISKAKIDNGFFNKLKSFFKDDEVLTQKHFISLEKLLPLKLSQKEIEYMIQNKEEIITTITTLIEIV